MTISKLPFLRRGLPAEMKCRRGGGEEKKEDYSFYLDSADYIPLNVLIN